MAPSDPQPPSTPDSDPPRFLGRFHDSVLLGFLTGLLAHGLVIPLLFSQELSVAVVLVGVVQLLWLGPLVLVLRRRGLRLMGKGVLIVLGLTLLVNTTCFGLLMVSGALIH